MSTQIYNLLFLIFLLCNQRITGATIEHLPYEIIVKILKYNDFSSDDYLSKVAIAKTLNKDNFFRASPQKILRCLGIRTPKLLRSCKKLYGYSVTNKKAPVSQEYESYIDFLIENQSIFNLVHKEKHAALNNLAYIFFNLKKEKFKSNRISPFLNNMPPLYEPFVFSLTFKEYPHYEFKIKNPNDSTSLYIKEQKRFFKNIEWFDKTFDRFPIAIGKKLVIIKHLSQLKIILCENNKHMLEKFLETPNLQKKFISILNKALNTNDCHNYKGFIRGINNPYKTIKSAENIMKVINFMLQYSTFKNNYYADHLDEDSDRFKNALILNDFLQNSYDQRCNQCLENQTQCIKILSEYNFYSRDSFRGYLLKFLLKQKSECKHTDFNTEKIASYIKKYHHNYDSENFLKIASLFQKFPIIEFDYGFFYCELLDKNSNGFKNLLNFYQHFQKEHLKEKIHEMFQKKKSKFLQDFWHNKSVFYDKNLKKLSCYCWQCNKERFYNSKPYLIGGFFGIALFVVFLDIIKQLGLVE